ncbi:hypothetical protein IF2G_05330 [Cordyceps javanica]|nr:hypothetical protein IF2G_05330 [Cordyceps javanica]
MPPSCRLLIKVVCRYVAIQHNTTATYWYTYLPHPPTLVPSNLPAYPRHTAIA